jgi:asparagine synthase (glutamine-hydrolysing)
MARALAEAGKHRGQADAAGKLASAWAKPESLPHPYFFTRALFAPERVAALLKNGAAGEDVAPWRVWLGAASREAAQLDRVSSITWLELHSYLANTLLRDTDAMSMSHSLEVRVPFLDHVLLEYVMSLPEPAKRRGKAAKALLVEALADLLPAEVVQQRKRTFTFPWKEWLRGALRERVAESLENLTPALQPLLNPTAVRSVWQGFLAGHTSWSRPWTLYVLNEWVRRNLEGTQWGLVGERSGAATSAT